MGTWIVYGTAYFVFTLLASKSARELLRASKDPHVVVFGAWLFVMTFWPICMILDLLSVLKMIDLDDLFGE